MTVGGRQRAVSSKHERATHVSRILVLLCLLPAFFLPAGSGAQQPPKIPRIAYVVGPAGSARYEAFRQGLRELGYEEGKNIVIDFRSNEGNRDRQHAIMTELVRSKVDVIVAVGAGDIRIAKDATATIPVVMIQGGDPVGSGFVASLARPGGNITGLATLRPELSGKRLELLKDIVPKLSRVALFASSASPDYAQVLKEAELAAGSLELKLQSHRHPKFQGFSARIPSPHSRENLRRSLSGCVAPFSVLTEKSLQNSLQRTGYRRYTKA